MEQIEVLIQELQVSSTYTCNHIVYKFDIGNVTMRLLESTVTQCAQAGPLTLYLYLRIALITHYIKEERK